MTCKYSRSNIVFNISPHLLNTRYAINVYVLLIIESYHYGGHLLNSWGGVGVIEVQSNNLAAKAVAGISVLTRKRLSHTDEQINTLVRSKGDKPTKIES